MQVEWSDEQQFLRDAVAGVIAREAPAATVRDWADARDFSAADALAVRQGWTGIGLDEAFGGQGGGTLELAVLAEQLGRGAVPWDRTLAGCLAAPLLAAAGNDLAAAVAEGERSVVLAADARLPLAVVPPGDVGYVLGAAGADVLVFRDGNELLAAEAVAAEPLALVDHTRAVADVSFSGATRSLGTVPAGALAAAANVAAVLVAADSLGAAARLLELTTQYVMERRQFGVAVGSFQAVKHAAAEMLVDVEAARSAVMHGAWAVGEGEPDAAEHAAVAKSIACEAAVRVADKALFLHGAVGYTWEHDLQFPFKRIKSNAALFGSPDAYRDRIAGSLIA